MITNNKELADILLPDVKNSPQYYEEKYPQRNLPQDAIVTRFGPSPTGFLHIGSLYAALIEKRAADQTGGVFFLRIEDTDKKREVENGVTLLLDGLKQFGIVPDEGVVGEESEKGNYGPYKQSERAEIYKTFVKELIARGLAYPCFCSQEELEKSRSIQEQKGIRPGYYGKWAKDRNLSFEEIEKNLKEGKTFVIRIKAPEQKGKTIKFVDLIKDEIEMPENDLDAVIFKSDGLPLYHFAHAVDDHFMRTTHVIRGDEWLPSVPLHIQLFEMFGWKVPIYAHVAPINKIDGNSKRKISKRKDPEAAVSYYREKGYPSESVIDYLLNLANSNFEEWRMENPKAPNTEFVIDFVKMGVSGPLFDFVKMNDISKNVIGFMTSEEVYEKSLDWAEEFDKELAELMKREKEYTIGALNIERNSVKPRKDIAKWSDVRPTVEFFYDDVFEVDENYDFSENDTKENINLVLESYVKVLELGNEKEQWFNHLKDFAETVGYARDAKTYKKNPDSYKGHVGDVAMILRVALTKKRNTPDLHEMINVMGKDRVQKRFVRCIEGI
ncbi:MAG TPA: glutamate--tRNA ligase [Lachnospiraceae bacterium]|nr:glutamate--tRNA ligase [Lachnospiraceae bacterium]